MCKVMETKLEALRYSFASTPNIGILVTALYILVITLGAIGNFLVILSVIRNPAMRSTRNFFIVNLALSDFLLCSLSVPFNIKMILFLYWDLGEIACNIVSTAQGINVFVSTMSIAAIGLDRYLLIIFPTKRMQQRTLIGVTFVVVWGLSAIFASPYFFATSVGELFANQSKLSRALRECGLVEHYKICKEDKAQWRALPIQQKEYTIACFLFQYFLPLFTLTFVYARIGCRMQRRLRSGPSSRSGNEERRRSVANRQRRTNILLIALVVIFATSWLPLNIYNTLIVFKISSYNLTVFAFCHIAGMMSACANPVLYGLLNDNFRTEFELIFEQLHILPCFRRIQKQFFPHCCGECSCVPGAGAGVGSAGASYGSQITNNLTNSRRHRRRLNRLRAAGGVGGISSSLRASFGYRWNSSSISRLIHRSTATTGSPPGDRHKHQHQRRLSHPPPSTTTNTTTINHQQPPLVLMTNGKSSPFTVLTKNETTEAVKFAVSIGSTTEKQQNANVDGLLQSPYSNIQCSTNAPLSKDTNPDQSAQIQRDNSIPPPSPVVFKFIFKFNRRGPNINNNHADKDIEFVYSRSKRPPSINLISVCVHSESS